jgi:hypothetical protein
MNVPACSVMAVLSACLSCFAGTPIKEQTKQTPDSTATLTVTRRVVASEPDSIFPDPFHCDADGNLYLQPYRIEAGGMASPVKKFSPQGELKATFAPESIPNFHTNILRYFAVDANGDVYELLGSLDDPNWYVAKFARDGIFKSNVKLDARIFGAQLAIFPSGEMLVSGDEQFSGEDQANVYGDIQG